MNLLIKPMSDKIFTTRMKAGLCLGNVWRWHHFTTKPSSAGHYTQVVWANTHEVGCGYISYPGKSSHSTTLVCNYKPGGNILSAAIYKVGKPCSDCPKGTKCDTKYRGLCVNPKRRLFYVPFLNTSSTCVPYIDNIYRREVFACGTSICKAQSILGTLDTQQSCSTKCLRKLYRTKRRVEDLLDDHGQDGWTKRRRTYKIKEWTEGEVWKDRQEWKRIYQITRRGGNVE
uniref:SCP domain-containing protein n=1 Tax=Timema douglasi TaxID=61478 RepID=A0A7R8VH08_TIMDO|nr:unnamed protein product [Timema douglasi]